MSTSSAVNANADLGQQRDEDELDVRTRARLADAVRSDLGRQMVLHRPHCAHTHPELEGVGAIPKERLSAGLSLEDGRTSDVERQCHAASTQRVVKGWKKLLQDVSSLLFMKTRHDFRTPS